MRMTATTRAADYLAIRATLESRAVMLHPWNDQHPGWHANSTRERCPFEAPYDATWRARLLSFDRLQRLTLALIACELVMPIWTARAQDPAGMPARWADGPQRCVTAVRAFLKGATETMALRRLKRELKGDDLVPENSWAGYERVYSERRDRDGFRIIIEVADWSDARPRDRRALVVDACYSLLIACWMTSASQTASALRDCAHATGDAQAFLQRWWRVVRCRMAFADAMNATLTRR